MLGNSLSNSSHTRLRDHCSSRRQK